MLLRLLLAAGLLTAAFAPPAGDPVPAHATHLAGRVTGCQETDRIGTSPADQSFDWLSDGSPALPVLAEPPSDRATFDRSPRGQHTGPATAPTKARRLPDPAQSTARSRARSIGLTWLGFESRLLAIRAGLLSARSTSPAPPLG